MVKAGRRRMERGYCMERFEFPYGRGHIEAALPRGRILQVLKGAEDGPAVGSAQESAVREALDNPVESPRLRDLAKDAGQVVIITCDHTRPMPSRITLPLLIEEIRASNPGARVTVLAATGCHRRMSKEETGERFGGLPDNITIVSHDCDDAENLVSAGRLPSGEALRINRVAAEADLLIAEGFIEPHFFAGYSGGRKSVLPGISSRRNVLSNHRAEFIADGRARSGVLEGNPVHTEMVYAAGLANLRYILNVALNGRKEIVYAVSGHYVKAHERGCLFVGKRSAAKAAPADIVITDNCGYPLDQNIYQAVKGICSASYACRRGGVVICAAACEDGHGSQSFYDAFASGRPPSEILESIKGRPGRETAPDQWQVQVLAGIMASRKVILVTGEHAKTAGEMGLMSAAGIEEAVEMAEFILGDKNAKITVIPHGAAMVIEPQDN